MATTLRCAIYTRKSSHEGLDQAFNSLDAQREACEAFIESQRHEGWRLVPTHYDDGGYSGGSMDRPALTQLLADLEAGHVQVIVVYKVDRLTRSLTDFSRMIESFDAREVSFVSVTQQFNTTTSMGRLTLNVLLSFAQFEREVTGERIRDKIAASKKKGMWMGGLVPLGYDSQERQLIINRAEAQTIRSIFAAYLELGTVRQLKTHLGARGVVSKVRVSQAGQRAGGKPLSRGALYKILNNRVYIGEITHKGASYCGKHDPIIEPSTWDLVQAKLRQNNEAATHGLRAKSPSLLAGKLFDDKGNPMSPSHAVKSGKRYRYYVSQAIVQQRPEEAGSLPRLPAAEIEGVVSNTLKDLLRSNDQLARLDPSLSAIEVEQLIRQRAADLSDRLDNDHTLLRRLVNKVTVGAKDVVLEMDTAMLAAELEIETRGEPLNALTARVAVQLQRCRGETKLVLGEQPTHQVNPALVKAVARACDWNRRLVKGDVPSSPCVRIDVAFIRERKTRGRERLVNETFTGIEREGNEESVGRNEVTGVGRGGIWNWSFDDPELVTSRSKSGSERGGETREAP